MATKYTDEQKTTVMMMLADGASVTDVWRTTGIPRTTISTWKTASSSVVSSSSSEVVLSSVVPSSSSEVVVPSSPSVVDTTTTTLLLAEVEALKSKLADLDKFLEAKEELFLWVAKAIRREAKESDKEGVDNKPIGTTLNWGKPRE